MLSGRAAAASLSGGDFTAASSEAILIWNDVHSLLNLTKII